MTELNFGNKTLPPRWAIDISPELDHDVEATVDARLLKMGVPLPLHYFYEKYGSAR